MLPGKPGVAVRAAIRPHGSPRLRNGASPPDRRWRWVAGAALAGAAALALSAFVHTQEPPQAPTPQDSLAELLHSPERVEQRQPTPGLALSFQGRGTLAGRRAAPRLAWETGALDVDLDPDADSDLVIQTREALIRVVGTRFTVTRDGPRTEVEVLRGQVQVRCAAGGGADLLAGQQHRCGPASEAGGSAAPRRSPGPTALGPRSRVVLPG